MIDRVAFVSVSLPSSVVIQSFSAEFMGTQEYPGSALNETGGRPSG